MDFGMEFEMVDGNVLYRGLSLFDTIKKCLFWQYSLSGRQEGRDDAPNTLARSVYCRFVSILLM